MDKLGEKKAVNLTKKIMTDEEMEAKLRIMGIPIIKVKKQDG